MSHLLAVALTIPLLFGQIEVDAAELDAAPERYDGRTVVITGEVIGDYGIRADVVWIHVNTDIYASQPLQDRSDAVGSNQGIGVRYPRDLHDATWGEPGSYGTQGPILRVEGVFHYNDTATSGETFVEATSIELVQASRTGVVRESETGIWIAAILSAVTGIALYASAWLRRRRRPLT